MQKGLVISFLSSFALLTQFASPAAAIKYDFQKVCTTDQKTKITNASSGLLPMAKKALAAVEDVESGKAIKTSTAYTQYVKWFGAVDKVRLAKVKKNLGEIVGLLQENQKFSAECLPKDVCEKGDYAASLYKHDFLIFCAEFFKAPLTGDNSQKGTILHEISHVAVDTEDHSYSKASTAKLALMPNQAIENADSYEYFIEGLQ